MEYPLGNCDGFHSRVGALVALGPLNLESKRDVNFEGDVNFERLAAGHYATGRFAIGTLLGVGILGSGGITAIGLMSFGLVTAIGLVAIGGCNAFGIVAIGGTNAFGIIAIGMNAWGVIAIGWHARGIFALSYTAASVNGNLFSGLGVPVRGNIPYRRGFRMPARWHFLHVGYRS